jgi:hypothetical protein
MGGCFEIRGANWRFGAAPIKKIKEKLPYLFQLAEVDNSRDGKLGMEIGSARERIVIALLIYKFGEDNIKTDIGITEAETDVIVFNEPISIKTATGKKISGIKLVWTVDSQKALDFSKKYNPSCGIILVQINWNNKGYLYFFPKDAQEEVLNRIGRDVYIKLPKQGTNPRGVEMSGVAISELSKHKDAKVIEIDWEREIVDYNPYDRWVDHWKE